MVSTIVFCVCNPIRTTQEANDEDKPHECLEPNLHISSNKVDILNLVVLDFGEPTNCYEEDNHKDRVPEWAEYINSLVEQRLVHVRRILSIQVMTTRLSLITL